MTEIDRIDRKILKLLQSDGRIATVDLAEKVGLSPHLDQRPHEAPAAGGLYRGL